MGSSSDYKKLKKQYEDILKELRQTEAKDDAKLLALQDTINKLLAALHVCPDGQTWDNTENRCVDVKPAPCAPIPCPEHQHFDQELCKCVWDNPPLTCPDKMHWDWASNTCVNDDVGPGPHDCDPGWHWDDNENECVPDTSPPPGPPPSDGGDKDIEGIQKLYKDDPDPVKSAQQWYLSKFGPNDSRVSGKGARKIVSGNVVQITPDQGTHPASARVYIRTTNPKALDTNAQLESGKDWQKMKKQKYMIGPEDFRNCEVSGYYKITKSSAEDEMTFYWMGGAHPSGDEFPLQCIACCNKAQIKMDMTPRAAKEYHHSRSPGGYAWNPTKAKFDLKSALGGTMVNKMIGQKLVMYVLEDANGEPLTVHLELYVDTQSKDLPKPDYTKQKWELFAEWIDDGKTWPDPEDDSYIQQCNAVKGQLISWGGPYVALRLDDNIWELHSLSIRPILTQKITA